MLGQTGEKKQTMAEFRRAGGNAFNLLHHLRRKEIIVLLRTQILAGKPYVGWSAGSAICAPTIRTTNDMPIIDPSGLDALGVIDFQLNAHYTNTVPEGFMGETRDQLLAEFVALNPTMPVFALPEGDWLTVRGEEIRLHGPFAGKWFVAGSDPSVVETGSVLGSPFQKDADNSFPMNARLYLG